MWLETYIGYEAGVTEGIVMRNIIRLVLPVLIVVLACGWADTGVTEYWLPNGLQVLLKKVEGMPLVSVWSWIHAGSANERPGITGVAHWCEHMNFKGTRTYSREDMKNLLEREGGAWNGYTWLDQTTYFETIPNTALELALDIEAQRLTESLFLPEEVASERSVIISELQMGENDPENLLDIEVTAAAIKAHPYGWPTIGWLSDIQAMTRDDLYGFYRRYYRPNNATLVVAGDFDEDETRRMIREKFGRLAAGEEIELLHTREPAQRGERRVTLERGGSTAYLLMAYHTPTIDSDDFFPLLALDTLLGGGESINLSNVSWRGQASKSSRLYRGLVDTGHAVKAGALYLPTKYPCLFYIYATAARGAGVAPVEEAALTVIEEVKEGDIPPREFEKVINQLRARYVFDTDSVSEQAHMLGFFATLGDHTFGETFLDRVEEVTAKDCSRVARAYLTEENRTVGWYLPTERKEADPTPVPADFPYREGEVQSRGPARYRETRPGTTAQPPLIKRLLRFLLFWRKEEVVRPGTRNDRSLPDALPVVKLDVQRRRLENGMNVLVRENHSSPAVVMCVDIAAGSANDPPGREGLAAFTAGMLERGTEELSAAQIAEQLDFMGAEFGGSCDRDRTMARAQVISGKFPEAVSLIARMLRSPRFPDDEIEKLRLQVITSLEEAAHDTQHMAVRGLYESIYPEGHPYRHRVSGEIASVNLISRKDLVTFYRSFYHPSRTTVVVSGDIRGPDVMDLMESLFGDWKTDAVSPTPVVSSPSSPGKMERSIVTIPDKSQVDLAIGFRGISRNEPDYHALQLMNSVLGRFGMGGRLGRAVREEQGLAYYAFSYFVPCLHEGPFLIRAGVNPDNVDRAIDTILGELMRMKEEGVTAEELEESRRFLIKSIPRQLETNAAVAEALASIEFFDLGLDYFERLPAMLGAVTREDILEAARAHLFPDRCAIIMAGPLESDRETDSTEKRPVRE